MQYIEKILNTFSKILIHEKWKELRMCKKIKKTTFFEDSLFTNASYLVANSVINSASGFIFWVIAARLYTTEDVGLASSIISVTGLISLFSNFGFNISLIRFIGEIKERTTELINSCLTMSIILTIIFSIIFVIGVDTLSPALSFIKSDYFYILIFTLLNIAITVTSLQESIFIGYRKTKLSFAKMVIQSVIKLPFIFFLGLFHSLGIIMSYAISFFIAILITSFILIPKINLGYSFTPTLNLHIMKKITNYSIGNYIAVIFETITYFTFPIIITNVLGPKMNAYFYIAWMIAGILFIIPKSVARSLFAEGSNDVTTLNQNMTKSLKAVFTLLIPAVFLIFIAGNQILMLFGEEYSIYGEKLLWIFTISVFPMVFNDIYISMKRVENNIKSVIYINAILSIGTLILSYLMMIEWGILGVGIAWLVLQMNISIYVIYKIYLYPRSFKQLFLNSTRS